MGALPPLRGAALDGYLVKGTELKKPLISLKHLHCSGRFARTFQALLFKV